MKHAAIALMLGIALVVFASGCTQQGFPGQTDMNMESPSYERKNISFIKMVSSENCIYWFDENEIAELKSLNINSIRICPLYNMMPGGNPVLVENENFYRNLIRKAHASGWAVLLEPNTAGPGSFPEVSEAEELDKLYGISLRWGEIAEDEKVEFYSPLNEPDTVFRADMLESWIEKSGNIKNIFSGNLVLKLADTGPENIENMSGYDYIAFDIIWSDSRYDELREHLDNAVRKGNALKEEYNLSGFFFWELGAEKTMVDEDTQAAVFETVLNETWEKVDGYCFLGWSNLEFSFRNRKAENTVREWFSR